MALALKDQLFNAQSIGDLAAEYSAALSGFDAEDFQREVMAGLAERALLQRLEWIADCLEPRLSRDFVEMAAQIEAAMPPALDPDLGDNDFGRFIHAVPGILAVRHGLEQHRARALDLLYQATQRFSMEFYIRPFLNRWPDETMARLRVWAGDDNYHVRRLVSEGTRPRLPWARKIDLAPEAALPLLDALHGDGTRYVTRSVANHMNDIAKVDADVVVDRLAAWQEAGQQSPKEIAWMTRHSLRTLVKQGHSGALALLGYRSDIDVQGAIMVKPGPVRIGEALEFKCHVTTRTPEPVIVDYVMYFHRPEGRKGRKVFKLKQGRTEAQTPLAMVKSHRLKGDATTFRLYPGPHEIALQVNGRVVAQVAFELEA